MARDEEQRRDDEKVADVSRRMRVYDIVEVAARKAGIAGYTASWQVDMEWIGDVSADRGMVILDAARAEDESAQRAVIVRAMAGAADRSGRGA